MRSCTFFSILFFLVFSLKVQAQTAVNLSTIEGVWQVVDSKGNAIHYIEIYKKDKLFFGKIVQLLNKENPEKVRCTQCGGALKNQAVLGLPIITNMERGRIKYSKGRYLDYEKGPLSPCTIWMESEDIIKVRIWWLFLYKTETWYRIS